MGLLMCYAWFIKQKEGIVMETTYYTFSANEIVVTGSGVEQVSGGQGRRMVYLRHSAPKTAAPAQGKVIDFDAWRASHETAAGEPESYADEEPEFEQERAPRTVPARRKAHGMYLDWLASVAVIAVAVSACVSFLM